MDFRAGVKPAQSGLLQLGEDRAQRIHLARHGERHGEFEMGRDPAMAGSAV